MLHASNARRLLSALAGLLLSLVIISPAEASEQRGSVSTALPAEFVTQAVSQAPNCQAVPDVVLPPVPLDRTLFEAAAEVGFELKRSLHAGDFTNGVRVFEESISQFLPTPDLVVKDGWLSPCEVRHVNTINEACFGIGSNELMYTTLMALAGQIGCPTGNSVVAPPITLEARHVANATVSRGMAMHLHNKQWDPAQFGCLNQLWTEESGWAVVKYNYEGSGAYGIPQALPGYKMSIVGTDWETSAATQISWGIGYIADRYGDPCRALAFKHSNGYY